MKNNKQKNASNEYCALDKTYIEKLNKIYPENELLELLLKNRRLMDDIKEEYGPFDYDKIIEIYKSRLNENGKFIVSKKETKIIHRLFLKLNNESRVKFHIKKNTDVIINIDDYIHLYLISKRLSLL